MTSARKKSKMTNVNILGGSSLGQMSKQIVKVLNVKIREEEKMTKITCDKFPRKSDVCHFQRKTSKPESDT